MYDIPLLARTPAGANFIQPILFGWKMLFSHGQVVLEEGLQRLAEAIDDEANLAQPGMVERVAAVKQKGGLGHGGVDALVVVSPELIPLRHHAHSMRAVACLP